MKKLFLIFLFSISFIGIQNTVLADDIEPKSELITEMDKDEIYPVFEQPEYKPAFFKMLLILIALIALIFLTFWIFRKLMRMRVNQTNLTKNIKILEKRALSPKTLLYIVEVDGRRVLISESNLEVRKLKDLE
ncbi:MAG: hypothetical protein KR126chlam6_00180 [Candidatus Anoxychlamydiales bacterium]|nr:hypothetical protein [Candidatus Anoxychlamydiales bacterium]